jgi:hypothetical protein
LFGLLPAIHAGRSRLTSDLTAGTRESSRASSRRINNALVVAQLSLSVVLLIAAGLVLKSFQRLTQVDLGFRPEGVTSVTLAVPRRISGGAGRPPRSRTPRSIACARFLASNRRLSPRRCQCKGTGTMTDI